MIGTSRIDEASKFLMHILYKTKRGSIEPDHFEFVMKSMVDKIYSNYKNILDFENVEENNLKNIYRYDNAESYCNTISTWIETINERLNKEFFDYKNKQKIQNAIAYIQENYNQNLNMAVVSNYLSMNYSLFSHEFKQFTGMNFVNYLKTIRINEAKRLLKDTELKIIEISQMVGYENEKNFMKSFRSLCGISPSEYRKNVQVGKMIQTK
jgi:YesN/AraC family two-component response regulator